jgi:hypothetical protein
MVLAPLLHVHTARYVDKIINIILDYGTELSMRRECYISLPCFWYRPR